VSTNKNNQTGINKVPRQPSSQTDSSDMARYLQSSLVSIDLVGHCDCAECGSTQDGTAQVLYRRREVQDNRAAKSDSSDMARYLQSSHLSIDLVGHCHFSERGAKQVGTAQSLIAQQHDTPQQGNIRTSPTLLLLLLPLHHGSDGPGPSSLSRDCLQPMQVPCCMSQY
jgi:hypothetical protein